MLFRIPWERDVDYTLLRRMIAFNRTEKEIGRASCRERVYVQV